MDITVKLAFWGVFKESFKQDSLQLAAGSSLEDLVTQLKDIDSLQLIESKGIFALAVNGELYSDYQYKLQDQDQIDVLPPVTGG